MGEEDLGEVVKGATGTLILKVSGFGLGYVFNLLLARLYGADVMGVYQLSVTVLTIAALVGRLGMSTAAVRLVPEWRGEYGKSGVQKVYRTMMTVAFPVACGLAVGLFLSAGVFAEKVFGNPEMQRPLRIVAVLVPTLVVTKINTGVLQGLKRVKEAFFFRTAYPSLANIVGLVGLTYFVARGLMTPIYAYAAGAGGGIAATSWLLYHALSRTVEAESEATQDLKVYDVLSLSLPMLVTSAMHFVMGWTDVLMLGYFSSADKVGIYNVALKMSLVTSFGLIAVNSILAPKFAELHSAGEHERLRRVIRFAARFLFWGTLPVFLVLVVFAEPILHLFGQEFSAGSIALIVLSTGQFVSVTCGSVGYFLDMTGGQYTFRNVMLAGGVINIILNASLIPLYGIQGAALATALSTALWNIAAGLAVYARFGDWIGFIPMRG